MKAHVKKAHANDFDGEISVGVSSSENQPTLEGFLPKCSATAAIAKMARKYDFSFTQIYTREFI